MKRRHFIKSGALFIPTIFVPRLIRAQANTYRDIAWLINRNRSAGSNDVVTSGLLAWWRFDEGTGTSVVDASGNGKTGTLSGGATWTTSNGSHGAVQFDGVNGKMAFSVDNASTTFSISMWIFPIASSDDYAALLANAANNTGLFYRGGVRKADYFIPGDNLNGTAMTESTWNHIVVVVTAGSGQFYLNNATDGTFTSATQITYTQMGDDTGSDTFKGKVSNVRIYNRALSAGEVSTLFSNP